MGAHLARRYLGDASVEPDPLQMPTFPPQYGFPERKERGKAQCAGAAGGSGERTRDPGNSESSARTWPPCEEVPGAGDPAECRAFQEGDRLEQRPGDRREAARAGLCPGDSGEP